MNKARVWIDNDNQCLYVEVTTSNGDILTHDEWGKYFTKRYVESRISYLFGNCIIQYM